MMRIRSNEGARRGTILAYLAISIVVLIAFCALAIDLGMVMIARTQAQNAADSAAFAAARSLSGGANANTTGATANGQAAANANLVLGKGVPIANVTITLGAYHYDYASETFSPQFPPVAPDNYNLPQATISLRAIRPTSRKALGISSFNVNATSIAAHRPRDTTIVLDFSGSMNNESDLWNCESYQGAVEGTSNNTDPTYPQWGFYNTTFSPLALMLCTSNSDLTGYCNITQAVGGCGPMVNDYYQNARGSAAVAAFAPAVTWPSITAAAVPLQGLPSVTVASQTHSATQPSGDAAPPNTLQVIASAMSGSSAGTTAMSPDDLIPNTGSGTTASPYDGRKLWGTSRFGYTVGPNYWGMTFYQWPPDPNNDWRQLYFKDSTGNAFSTAISNGANPTDNTALFASNGSFNSPTGNYTINYAAILGWIRANCVQQTPGDGRPFPTTLRSSNQVFYTSIPTDVPPGAYTWTNRNNQITSSPDPSVRFWKEYIDFVIGVWHDPSGNIQVPGTSTCSYGPDFTAGASSSGTGISISGPDSYVYFNGSINTAVTVSVTAAVGLRTSASTVTFNTFPLRRHSRDRHRDDFERPRHGDQRHQRRLRLHVGADHHLQQRDRRRDGDFAEVHVHEPDRQPQTSATSLLVRSHDHDPVHVRHGHPSPALDDRHLDAAGQAGHLLGATPRRHQEQSSERPGLDEHVQPAALQRRTDQMRDNSPIRWNSSAAGLRGHDHPALVPAERRSRPT